MDIFFDNREAAEGFVERMEPVVVDLLGGIKEVRANYENLERIKVTVVPMDWASREEVERVVTMKFSPAPA